MTYTKYEDIPNRREPLSGRDHIQHIEDGLEAVHKGIDGLEFSDIGGTASSGQIPSLAIAKITGLQDALDAKADDDHGHDIGDVSGLQAALDGKAATSHTHSEGDITGLSARLSAIEARLDALEEPEA